MLLDCTLEYKKGESQTQIEISDEKAWEQLLQQEEDAIKARSPRPPLPSRPPPCTPLPPPLSAPLHGPLRPLPLRPLALTVRSPPFLTSPASLCLAQAVCDEIIEFKPDLVVTEKGVSDLAQHYLLKANVSVLRRVRKTDNNRIARACGATIVHRTSELTEKDIGTGCGLFEVKKIGDEYFTWVVDCEAPKACTILLRGASKDVLNEIERNLGDAMNVVRTIYQVSPRSPTPPSTPHCSLHPLHPLSPCYTPLTLRHPLHHAAPPSPCCTSLPCCTPRPPPCDTHSPIYLSTRTPTHHATTPNYQDPRVVPGGGAAEMTLAHKLIEGSKSQEPMIAGAYRAAGTALEVIPRTLLENCGADIIRVLTQLRAKHAGGCNSTWGVDGEKGVLADMAELGVWEPLVVKQQTIKTAVESASMLLRIDEIVSGTHKKQPKGRAMASQPDPEATH